MRRIVRSSGLMFGVGIERNAVTSVKSSEVV
jgi:hypothetical protein